MKVILLVDIPHVGRKNDVKEVSDGYASNFLIPRRLAEKATDSKVVVLERQKLEHAQREKVEMEQLRRDLKKVEGKRVSIKTNANEKGHLFKGVSTGDVAAAIEKELNVRLPEESISMKKPLKEMGEYQITVQGGDSEVSLTLVVERTAR